MLGNAGGTRRHCVCGWDASVIMNMCSKKNDNNEYEWDSKNSSNILENQG